MPTFTLTQRHLVVKVPIHIWMLFIFSTPVLNRHLWQLKTVVFLHWCLMHAILLAKKPMVAVVLVVASLAQATANRIARQMAWSAKCQSAKCFFDRKLRNLKKWPINKMPLLYGRWIQRRSWEKKKWKKRNFFLEKKNLSQSFDLVILADIFACLLDLSLVE